MIPNEYEPEESDTQFLNELDQGYIGLERPKIVREVFYREEYPDHDNDPADPEQAWA